MSIGRFLPAVDYRKIKLAIEKLVVAVGSHRAIAEQIGRKRHQLIGEWADPENPKFPPADVVADLEALAGRPYITEKLAELSDHILVPIPTTNGEVCGLSVGQIASSVGKLMTDIGDAAADLEITPDECPKLLEDVRKSMADMAYVAEQLRDIQARGEAHE